MSIESCKSADLSLEVSKFERNGGLMGTHENNKYWTENARNEKLGKKA